MTNHLKAASCALAIGLLLPPALADAQGGPSGPGCNEPDRIIISDLYPGAVGVFYSNSVCGRSEGMSELFTTPGGVTLRIVIDVNVDGEAQSERITVYPKTPGYFADPGPTDVPDGGSVTIYVTQGWS